MTIHKPVLLEETIELLNIKKGDVVVDATLGGGGHGLDVLKKIGQNGVLVAIDADIEAIKRFLAQFSIFNFQFSNNFQIPIYKFKNVILVNSNFINLGKILDALGIEKVDAILADLGWSSDQLEDVSHGMSFLKSAPLDMRYDRSQELTAGKIINEYPKEKLERILKEYGEEKFSQKIVKEIVAYRERKIIECTTELAEIIKMVVPAKYRYAKINPATKTFQALRIETNKELESLEKFIPQAIEKLNSDGRLGIITFHSLEDRIVKNSFRENAGGCICPPNFPQCVCGKKSKVRIITKKPVAPGGGEGFLNPRSRSAKLRVIEKI